MKRYRRGGRWALASQHQDTGRMKHQLEEQNVKINRSRVGWDMYGLASTLAASDIRVICMEGWGGAQMR